MQQIDISQVGISQWYKACQVSDAAQDGGICIRFGDEQIAIFYFVRLDKWYATQNECPHKKQMALSRGMIGTKGEEPKVACPFHKKTFSLQTGECLSGDECSIRTYPVRIENDYVFIDVSQHTTSSSTQH